jgi:arginine utilization regulatory protein
LANALAASNGNVTRAARQLGISRQLLHYKIKKHHLRRADFLPEV